MDSDVFQLWTLINPNFTFEATYAMDKDLSTFAYADNFGLDPSTEVWLKVSFSDVWLVDEVTLYLIFKDDWFYSPEIDSVCYATGSFESCKTKEDKATVELYNGETLVRQCGDQLNTVSDGSQSDQIYSFPCDDAGDSVLLSAWEDGGVIRVSEIVVTTRTPNCTANWYLVTPYNLCVECDPGLYSYGGSSSGCTQDRTLITPSMWEPIEPVGEDIPITSLTTWNGNTSGVLLTLDKDLSTYYELEGGWMRVEFGELYHVHQIVLYLIFYTDWFYFPVHHCLLSEPDYQECKDDESGLSLDLYTGGSIGDNCGDLITSHDTTQTGQIYVFTCDKTGDAVLFTKDSGHIHILDVVISTLVQNCAGNHYLKPINNLCLSCDPGYYSYGGGSTSCTEDKQEVSFSWWEPLPVEGELIPTSVSQHVSAGPDFGVDSALDKDLTTYSLTLESGGEVWVKLQFPHDYFIYMVVLYQVFYTNWFYYPSDECHLSENNYQGCKDLETGVDVDVYKGPDFVHNCGTLSTTYQLTQSSQIFSLTCDSIGDTVLLSKTSGEIKIYQVIIRTRAQSCPEAHHLNTTDNLCYPCPEDTYSSGGYTTTCTDCPEKSSTPAGTAATESDCKWTWGGVSVEQYIAYDLDGYPLELKVAAPDSEEELVYGNITLTFHNQGQDVGEAVQLSWYEDKIEIENLCTGSVFESPGEDQTVVVASFGEDVVFHFVGTGGGLATFTLTLSDCGEGKENYDMMFLSNIPTLSARHSSDCKELDGSWDHVTAVTASDLPAVFTAVVQIGCEEGYFNVGDRQVTCIGNDTFHSEGQGPDCQPRPNPEENQVPVTGVTLSSPLSECGAGNSADPAGAFDNDLSTCSGAHSPEGADTWMKLHINRTYINHVILYTGFFDYWYTPEDPCVTSVGDYQACKDDESGVLVDVYLGPQLVKSCGTLSMNHATKQSDQIYRMQCNAEGDSIQLSKADGTIRVYEAVVTSQECAVLEVEHGIVTMETGTKHVTVTCDPNYQFYGGDGGLSRCINGTWYPGPYCLPTCLSVKCEPSESCRDLHGLPLCYSDCGDPQAPLNGSLVTHNATHATTTCDNGFTLLGSSLVRCLMETGLWEDGPWCSPDVGGSRSEVYAITRPLFNATRLIKALQIRWTFTASCPPYHIVKTCKCLLTEDFPGNCEGSEVSGEGTECLFTNSPSNNVQNMQGLAVCVKNKTIRNPCNYREELPFHTQMTSSPSHHPHVVCGSLSHPTPASCHVVVRHGDVLLDWRGDADKTSKVEISGDGSCSVKCFDEGKGSCVLSLRCTSRHLLRDKSLRSQYKAEKCPTCSVMVCSVFERCLLGEGDGLPTCQKYCAPFPLPNGLVYYTDTTALVTCQDKYYYSRTLTTLSCNYRNGRWEPDPGRCIIHTCETYTCNEEEYCDLVAMDPPPYIHSYTPYDNSWIPRCFKRCPDITLPHGRVERHGRTAHVICPAYYYKFTGASVLECLPGGEWSEDVPTCEPALCEVRDCDLHQFCVEQDGLATCRVRCATLTAHHGTVHDNNQTAEVECDSGYYGDEDRVVTCQSDGKWSADLPSCRLKCPVSAESIPPHTGTQITTFASITTICNQGYVLDGMATRTCLANGTWGGAHVTCQPASCDLVNCAEYHKCVVSTEGIAQCELYTVAELEVAVSSCLQTVLYEDDCDENLAVVKELVGQAVFVSVLATSMTKVDLEGPKQPYLISKKFLREIEMEQEFTDELQQAILDMLHHYSSHIKSLKFRENREVLVKQCMKVVNSVIRSVQYEQSKERALRTPLQAKQAWHTASDLHRGNHGNTNTVNVFNTGTDSQLLSSLRLVAQELLENLRER